MNKIQRAEQVRRALQMFAQSLTDDEAMEIATIYPKYEIGKRYKTNDMFTYGKNAVGDPQLFRVLQDHISQSDWPPNITPSLYYLIGLTEDGFPVWSQPSGAHDAYNNGDIVSHNGLLYVSLIDGNVYSPEEYPAGWKFYEP